MLRRCAPISITVYERLTHLQQCVNSLLLDDLSSRTDLYIYSDAARPGDENRINQVRSYINSINGFLSVNLVCQPENNYVKNMKDAREIPLSIHGVVIRLEDDVVVAPGFLKFMNTALEFYNNDMTVFCICGYTSPINAKYEGTEAMALSCVNGSGLGYWKSKYDLMMKDYNEIHPAIRLSNNYRLLARYISIAGFRGFWNLWKMKVDGLFQGDRLFTEYLIRNNYYAVIPPVTLTLNRGHDGSGVHARSLSRFQHEEFLILPSEISFPNSFEGDRTKVETKKYLSRLTSMTVEVKSFFKLIFIFISARCKK